MKGAVVLALASSAAALQCAPRRAPPAARAAPLTMVDDNPIGVGIIGAGRIGLVHLEALSSCPDARPVIISNPTLSKAKAAAETYPGMAWTSDDTEVINHPDVDAVWICSPSQASPDSPLRASAAPVSSLPSLFALPPPPPHPSPPPAPPPSLRIRLSGRPAPSSQRLLPCPPLPLPRPSETPPLLLP